MAGASGGARSPRPTCPAARIRSSGSLCSCLKRHRLLELGCYCLATGRPAKLCAVEPHAMQNHCELSRKGNFRSLQANSRREPDSPGFQCRPPAAVMHHRTCGLIKRGPHLPIAAFADAARDIGFPRSISPGRQSEMNPHIGRFHKTLGHIDPRFVGKGHDCGNCTWGLSRLKLDS